MVARLRFVPAPLVEATPADDEVVVVLDTIWTPLPDQRHPSVVGLRDMAEAVMTRRWLTAEASSLLDRWAEASGVVEATTLEGVSFWYGARLGHSLWLVDQLLWLGVLDDLLVANPGVGELVCDAGTDPALVAAARLVAARDGLRIGGQAVPLDASAVESPGLLAADEPTLPPVLQADPHTAAPFSAAKAMTAKADPSRRPVSFLGRLRWRVRPPEQERRRRLTISRLNTLAAEANGRLLVVQAHVPQRIDTGDGPRFLNAYLGPVLNRLRGGRLDPFEVDLRTTMAANEEAWTNLEAADRGRRLPIDVLATLGVRAKGEVKPRDAARARVDRLLASSAPMLVGGVDLGPDLALGTANGLAKRIGRSIVEVPQMRALLRRVHPAGILLADEYHRQDWLAAAAAEGVPVAAVQHGVISPLHTGYIHDNRPPELRLPYRTYVFGPWERDLLTRSSCYRPEEVVVGGSPRLDLVHDDPETTRYPDHELRHELGVASGDRMVVLSGTWGAQDRRFQYPIALARLFAEPLEHVHLVVKLHPSERDQGPYRAIIEGVAAAGGFAPPPITVVQTIDLYRVLAAAEAHLGVHSTLLTEAVATGTPNLLAAGLAGADLLGYVDAGVAVPVRTTDDIRRALDVPRSEIMKPQNREAFLRAHFEPGNASQRIADDLLAWMGRGS